MSNDKASLTDDKNNNTYAYCSAGFSSVGLLSSFNWLSIPSRVFCNLERLASNTSFSDFTFVNRYFPVLVSVIVYPSGCLPVLMNSQQLWGFVDKGIVSLVGLYKLWNLSET